MTSSGHAWQVETWTQAKSDPELNEDVALESETAIVLADGATDKGHVPYPSGKTGGRLVSEIAANIALHSSSVGYELADEVTKAVQAFYYRDNPAAVNYPSKRASTTLAVARQIGEELVVTQIGDTNVRLVGVDGVRHILTNDKRIDDENAKLRAGYIRRELTVFEARHGRHPNEAELEAIVAGGRSVIQGRLNMQYRLQNNAEDVVYGYGIIDGTQIPRIFMNGEETNYVKTHRFSVTQIASVELVSDGFYGVFPATSEAVAYQALYRQIHNEDPGKYLKYLSTKPKDDATVAIATFANA